MFDKPIIIYSEKCNHSVKFLNILKQHDSILQQFMFVNIDSKNQLPQIFYQIQTQLNYKITHVPTIIVDNGESVFTDENAFKWLDWKIKEETKPVDLNGFNPNEMGAFSDSYSKFGSTDLHDASVQSFKFVNLEHEKIITPTESSVISEDEYNRKQLEREHFVNSPNVNKTLPQQNLKNIDFTTSDFGFANNTLSNKSKNIDFTTSDFGFANKMGTINNNTSSNKSKDIDNKLQHLLSQREEFTPEQPSLKNEDIDWTTGNIVRQ